MTVQYRGDPMTPRAVAYVFTDVSHETVRERFGDAGL